MLTFLTIARVLYDKGYDVLVSASKSLRADGVPARFQWLGAIDPQYPNHVPAERVDADVAEGLIDFLGYRTDVPDIIRAADAIVLPSYYPEGLSRSLMEAIAMGKPVITTDIPGCRETVDDGVNGFLCAPRDAASLADALRSFAALTPDERAAMGRASRQKAERQFDIRDVIRAYDAILRDQGLIP